MKEVGSCGERLVGGVVEYDERVLLAAEHVHVARVDVEPQGEHLHLVAREGHAQELAVLEILQLRQRVDLIFFDENYYFKKTTFNSKYNLNRGRKKYI